MKSIRCLFFLGLLLNGLSCLRAADATPANHPTRIAFGEEVRLEDHLVAGKTVIFEFTSRYCGPCQIVAPLLERYAREHDDVVVIAVDINRPGVKGIDWQSPVALQHGITYVPQFKVFGPDGKLVAEKSAADDLVLKQWLNFSWPAD